MQWTRDAGRDERVDAAEMKLLRSEGCCHVGDLYCGTFLLEDLQHTLLGQGGTPMRTPQPHRGIAIGPPEHLESTAWSAVWLQSQ